MWLDKGFWRSLRDHPVPVREEAIKPTFLEALNRAPAVYPEARVDADKEGLVIHPSPPAVPRSEARRLGIA